MRQSMNQIIFAAVLLFVGIFLLLVNVGVISLEIKELIVELYPFVMLLFSVLLLIKALKNHYKASLFWGIFFFAFSIMLSLDRFELISFQFNDFWKLWPVFIIYYGMLLLLRKDKIRVIFRSELPTKISGDMDDTDLNKWRSGDQSKKGEKNKRFLYW